MPEALDPVPLLKHLHEHGIEHIIIGGFAVVAHGHVRTSKDLDIVPDPAPENLQRLARLLAEIEAQHVGLEDFSPEELPFDRARQDNRWWMTGRLAAATSSRRRTGVVYGAF